MVDVSIVYCHWKPLKKLTGTERQADRRANLCVGRLRLQKEEDLKSKDDKKIKTKDNLKNEDNVRNLFIYSYIHYLYHCSYLQSNYFCQQTYKPKNSQTQKVMYGSKHDA